MAKVAEDGHFNKPEQLTEVKKDNHESPAHKFNTTGHLVHSDSNTTDTKVSDGLDSFLRKARKKALSQAVSSQLLQLHSPLWKGYYETYNCASVLLQDGKRVTGQYCRRRWCNVCAGVRTNQLINGYKNALEATGEILMVTLTFRSVLGKDLTEAVKTLNTTFSKVMTRLKRKHRIKWVGIRGMESSYNQDEETFNPHIHFATSNSYEECQLLVWEWLKEFPETASHKAQDIRGKKRYEEITGRQSSNPFLEIFKYTTKLIDEDKIIPPPALDTIFQAFNKVRTVQVYGLRKQKIEEKRHFSKEIEFKKPQTQIYYFVYADQHNNYVLDWKSPNNEGFTGYRPDSKTLDILRNIDQDRYY